MHFKRAILLHNCQIDDDNNNDDARLLDYRTTGLPITGLPDYRITGSPDCQITGLQITRLQDRRIAGLPDYQDCRINGLPKIVRLTDYRITRLPIAGLRIKKKTKSK